MRLKLCAILCALLLLTGAGCPTKQVAPPIVNKAVWTPCPTDIPQRPVFAADSLSEDDDIFTKGMALWADRRAREAYETALAVRLKGCVDQPPATSR